MRRPGQLPSAGPVYQGLKSGPRCRQAPAGRAERRAAFFPCALSARNGAFLRGECWRSAVLAFLPQAGVNPLATAKADGEAHAHTNGERQRAALGPLAIGCMAQDGTAFKMVEPMEVPGIYIAGNGFLFKTPARNRSLSRMATGR